MKGLWHHQPDSPFGPDTLTYEKAIAWLDGFGLIEDWGCGTARAKGFVKYGPYRGVDGSPPYADVIADLREYRSDAPCIVMRHVLDHNAEWRLVLANALASFQVRMVLVLFVPMGTVTREIARSKESKWWEAGIPDMQFSRDDLMPFLQPYLIREERVLSKTAYGVEHVFYLQK